MGVHITNVCFITGLPVKNLITDEVFTIDYEVDYNNLKYTFKFHSEFIENPIKEEEKHILKCLLFNNEWPIDSDTKLTKGLIHNLINFGTYPKNFADKRNYLLCHLYFKLEEGLKATNLAFKESEYAFAKDTYEYIQIVQSLQHDEFAKALDKNNIFFKDFFITEKGRELAKTPEVAKWKPVPFKSNIKNDEPHPKIFLAYTTDDAKFGEKLLKKLSNSSLVISTNPIKQDSSFLHNIKNNLNREEFDLILFVQSYGFNNNNIIKEFYSIAKTAKNSKASDQKLPIFIAKIDDSPINDIPDIYDYPPTDVRISWFIDRLISNMINQWRNVYRNNRINLSLPSNNIDTEKELKQDNLNNSSKKSNDRIIPPMSRKSWKITDANVNDALKAEELANEIIEIIEQIDTQNEKGAMFGIFGKWGRGKTYLWNLIKEKIAEKPFHIVEFQAWKYQNTPAIWAYLYETFANAYLGKKPENNIIKYVWFKFKIIWFNIKRRGVLQVFIILCASLALGVIIFYILNHYGVSDFSKKLSLIISSFIAFVLSLNKTLKPSIPKIKELIKSYSTKYSFKTTLGIQSDIENELVILLKIWIPVRKKSNHKILLFIDDLDRCNEEKLIEIIDSLRIMLDNEEITRRLIIIMAIDETFLKAAIRKKYNFSLPILFGNEDINNREKSKNEVVINQYIDKLFICGIKLGVLDEESKQAYFDKLTDNKVNILLNKPIENTNTEHQMSEKIGIRDQVTLTITNLDQNIQNDTVPVPPTLNFELESFEQQYLRESLKHIQDCTPRKIRIFYYRYLLGRNLLLKKIENTNLNQEWRNLENDCKILPFMIIHYDNNIEGITYDRDKIPEELLLTNSYFGEEYKIDRFLYKSLVNVVEMVIPY